jgi:hypothetical protein
MFCHMLVTNTGFGLAVEFMGHLELADTSNYNAITNSRTLILITAHTKSSQFTVSSCTRCLVTAFDSVDYLYGFPA